MADLFAGLAIALLIILVTLWLQALSDGIKATEFRIKAEKQAAEALEYKRKMKTMEDVQEIFKTALDTLKDDDDIISVDRKRGEITLRVEQVFGPGQWRFKPDRRTLEGFVLARSKLSEMLDTLDQKFNESATAQALGLSAHDHVELLITGHTDCKQFRSDEAGLVDNWDLSTLRASALARFFTEPCKDSKLTHCCIDGTLKCESHEMSSRIDAEKWSVLAAGRGQFQPTIEPPRPPGLDVKVRCDGLGVDKEWLRAQRRVVIQIVPRLDRVAVRMQQDDRRAE